MKTNPYFRAPSVVNVWANRLDAVTTFQTASGEQIGQPGDYVIDYGGAPGTDTAPYPCPAAQFERTYKAGAGLSFGLAVMAMKRGMLVQRAGWNGKGMHVYLEDATSMPFLGGAGRDKPREYRPCMVLYTADGAHQPGWNASTPDVLADDWQIVE